MESAAAHLDEKIMRLKRQLGRDDLQGHSCQQCNQITLKSIPAPGWRLGEGIKEREEKIFFQHDTTVAEIHALAASGCNLWIIVSNQLKLIDLEEKIQAKRDMVALDFQKHRYWWSDEYYEDLVTALGGAIEKEYRHLRSGRLPGGSSSGANCDFAVTHEDFVRVMLRYGPLNDFKDKSVDAEITLVLPERPIRRAYFPEGTPNLHLTSCGISFWVLSNQGNLGESTMTCVGLPINLNPGSPSAMDLYRNWLQTCANTHSCGLDDLPGSMPSLALVVSDKHCVKLIHVAPHLKERYVALSYCWGIDMQTIMLTRSNEVDLLRGIDPQELDPTIRDSVTVARELGFRLLWIDALCIFQDDEEWKTKELGSMGKIYQNATLTIVVSAAANVKEGFLHRRTSTLERVGLVPGHPRPVLSFRAEDASREGKEELVVLRPHMLDEIELWYERAWTLQEMLFSGRRLQFRDNQTTWLCHCAEVPAQEADGWLSGTGHNYTGYSDSHFEPIMRMMRSVNKSTETKTVLANWYNLVDVYSDRKLRYFRDRLPAISGIAKQFASIIEDEYICGLWKSDITIGLAWFPHDPRHPVSGVKTGPSWSWASYEGAAVWWEYKRKTWRPNQDLEVLDYTIELVASDNPFGEVKTAELSMRGLLLRIPTPVRDEYGNIHIKLDERPVSVVFEYPNDPRVQPSSEYELSLLVLVNTDWLGVEGLVLLKEGDNRYSRVGWFGLEDIWPVTEETRWVKRRHRTPKSQEELQDRVRSVWGGEQNIQNFILV